MVHVEKEKGSTQNILTNTNQNDIWGLESRIYPTCFSVVFLWIPMYMNEKLNDRIPGIIEQCTAAENRFLKKKNTIFPMISMHVPT